MDSNHVIDIGPRPSIAVEGSSQRFFAATAPASSWSSSASRTRIMPLMRSTVSTVLASDCR